MSEKKIILAVWQDEPDTPLKLLFDGNKEQIMKIIRALTAGTVEEMIEHGAHLPDIEESLMNPIAEAVTEGIRDGLDAKEEKTLSLIKDLAEKIAEKDKGSIS